MFCYFSCLKFIFFLLDKLLFLCFVVVDLFMMSLFITLIILFVLIKTFVCFEHVLECVHVQIRYFQFFELLIIDMPEAKLEYNFCAFGLLEERSHIHSELSFGLFLSLWVDVFRSNFLAVMN